MNVKIRPFQKTDDEYAAIVQVYNAVWPDYPTTVEQFRHSDKTRDVKYLFQRLVIEADGKIIGLGAYLERSWAHVDGNYMIACSILPDYQNRGIGTAFYQHVMAILQKRGVRKIYIESREDKPIALHLLKKWGYKSTMTFNVSNLKVADFDKSRFAAKVKKVEESDVRLYTLAELQKLDPNWKVKFYEAMWEFDQDVPCTDPPTKPSFERFEGWLKSPGFTAEGIQVAVDPTVTGAVNGVKNDTFGRYVGVSALILVVADKKKLETGLTAVSRDYRRRGLATTLKVRAIEFAKYYGAEIIETDNEANNPMYDLNMQLGFYPVPAWMEFEKILESVTVEDHSTDQSENVEELELEKEGV